MTTIVEDYLRKNGGRKVDAAAELAADLMRGDPAEFKLGYSIGNALLAVIEHYNLSPREVALAVEKLVERTAEHSSATRRPLVITGSGGGVEQWAVYKPGLGTPRRFAFDYDEAEDAHPEMLRDMVEQHEEALTALLAYGDPEDAFVVAGMRETITEYREHIADGTSPGRYR
jgi:hypothetical protein